MPARPDRRLLGRLDRPHVELQLVAEALDAPEHAHGIPFGETPVQEVDVVPDAALDAAARVDELEREVVRARARTQSPFARDGVGALDDASSASSAIAPRSRV